MSFLPSQPNQSANQPAPPAQNVITGARRMSLEMLMTRERADTFTGLPRGTAKPLRILSAFQEAEPYLGLPSQAFKLVSWLMNMTQPQDWEEGSRPMAWPSAKRQQEFLCLSAARVKMLNRALFEAGIFVIRDNEQGKRYGRRTSTTGRIIAAYGFDLSPLAQRMEEFVRIAAAAQVERNRKKTARSRITFARRAIRQVWEQLVTLGLLPDWWGRLEAEKDALIRSSQGVEQSDGLFLIAHALEQRKDEAEQWFKAETARQALTQKPVKTSPSGLENEPHTTTTNLTPNLKDTVVAAKEGSSELATPPPLSPSAPPSRVQGTPQGANSDQAGEAPPPPTRRQPPPPTAEREFRLKAGQLLDLAPRLAACVLASTPTWEDITTAASTYLRPELGVSPSLWGEACRLMGREQATLALAIVSTKPASFFTRGAGGYFAGMVKKHQRGELHLERSLWALRNETWGGMATKPRGQGAAQPTLAAHGSTSRFDAGRADSLTRRTDHGTTEGGFKSLADIAAGFSRTRH